MLTFLCAVYNEEEELADLLESVDRYVDAYAICDDGSTDLTLPILGIWHHMATKPFEFKTIDHTGLCEVARIHALDLVQSGSWILMCDADERFENLEEIAAWVKSDIPENVTHVYFDQLEYIDGEHVRTFQKAKLFKKESITLPEMIHGDPAFVGDPVSFGWKVTHRKTSKKQILREKEYLQTYNRLFEEGKIDKGRLEWMRNLHHYIREEPHG